MKLNPETKKLLKEIHSRRDYFAETDDEELINRAGRLPAKAGR
jgi:hypothetical protein